eukprot:214067_1
MPLLFLTSIGSKSLLFQLDILLICVSPLSSVSIILSLCSSLLSSGILLPLIATDTLVKSPTFFFTSYKNCAVAINTLPLNSAFLNVIESTPSII